MASIFSVPAQFTSSSHIGPVPWPKAALSIASPPLYPNCRQTTLAAFASKPSLQIVPHAVLKNISTRPCSDEAPPARRRSYRLVLAITALQHDAVQPVNADLGGVTRCFVTAKCGGYNCVQAILYA